MSILFSVLLSACDVLRDELITPALENVVGGLESALDEQENTQEELINDQADDELLENPIVGNWIADRPYGGYFEFTYDEFRWFEAREYLDDNFFWGTYTFSAGAMRHNGELDYGEEGHEIFTIYLTFLGQQLDGITDEIEAPGALTIQRLGSDDSLFVFNHVAGHTFNIDRVLEGNQNETEN